MFWLPFHPSEHGCVSDHKVQQRYVSAVLSCNPMYGCSAAYLECASKHTRRWLHYPARRWPCTVCWPRPSSSYWDAAGLNSGIAGLFCPAASNVDVHTLFGIIFVILSIYGTSDITFKTRIPCNYPKSCFRNHIRIRKTTPTWPPSSLLTCYVSRCACITVSGLRR